MAAAGLLAGVLLAGVIVVIIRDKDGKEIGRYEIPEGGKVEIAEKQDKKGGDTAKVTPENLKTDATGERKAPAAPPEGTFVTREPAAVEPPRLIKAHTDSIYGLDFSPDGKLVATYSRDKTVCIWDVATGERRARLFSTDEVLCARFSHDGKTVASGSPDKVVTFWSVADGKEVGALDTGPVRNLRLSPDGARLATSAGSKFTAHIWDLKTKKRAAEVTHRHEVSDLAFSPDGKLLATASTDQHIELCDAETGENRHMLRGHSKWVETVAFRADGKTLVSGSPDHTVRVWDAKTGKCVGVLDGQTGESRWATPIATGPLVLTGGADGSLLLWAPAGCDPLKVLKNRPVHRACAVSPTGGPQLGSPADSPTSHGGTSS